MFRHFFTSYMIRSQLSCQGLVLNIFYENTTDFCSIIGFHVAQIFSSRSYLSRQLSRVSTFPNCGAFKLVLDYLVDFQS